MHAATLAMRVSIRQREVTRGIWRNIRQVAVITTVSFSEVEKRIIAKRQLADFIVLKRNPDFLSARRREYLGLGSASDMFDLSVSDLLKRRQDRFVCDTAVHAKIYEKALIEALAALRSFIAENEALGTASILDF